MAEFDSYEAKQRYSFEINLVRVHVNHNTLASKRIYVSISHVSLSWCFVFVGVQAR